MVVKTVFSKRDFKQILSNYDIGEFKDFKHFRAGSVQTNILIKTNKGKFVLRYYEEKPKKLVQFEANLLDYLSKHKYPCAMPIHAVDGKIIGEYKKKPYIVFNYLEGRHLKNINDKQLHGMMRALAQLHNISKGYKPINYKLRQPRTKEFCLHEAKIEAKRFKNKEKGRERLNIIKNKLSKLKFPNALPKGVMHGDFDKANIKFVGDKVSGILDFDDATYTFLIYDVGVVLLYWTRFYLKKFDFKKARKIIKLYEKYRPLSKKEKLHVYDALQLHALMIMAWLMYDDWRGKDIFKKLSGILDELDQIGRKEFYKKVFS